MRKTVTYINPVARAMLQQRKSPQVVPPKKGNKRKLTKKENKMRYEMQNFIKFSKTKASKVGQSKHNDDWKRERKIARKQKQLQRKVAK